MNISRMLNSHQGGQHVARRAGFPLRVAELILAACGPWARSGFAEVWEDGPRLSADPASRGLRPAHCCSPGESAEVTFPRIISAADIVEAALWSRPTLPRLEYVIRPLMMLLRARCCRGRRSARLGRIRKFQQRATDQISRIHNQG